MYSRIKAIDYAKKHSFLYNPNFYDFSLLGGDCTNFVSQCLLAGGIEMDFSTNGWFYNSLQARSPSWTSVESLWNYSLKNLNIKLKQVNIENLEIGDIVQFYDNFQKRYYHCVLITKIIRPIKIQNIFVASHDNNAYNKSLSLYNVSGFRFGKILN